MGLFEKLRNRSRAKGLIQALSSNESEARQDAARELGDIGNADAVVPLLRACCSGCDAAKDALLKLGDRRCVSILVKTLRTHSDYDMKKKSSEILVLMKPASAIPDLNDALNDDAMNVGFFAATVLKELGDFKGVQTCIRRLGDSKSRYNAADSLRAFGREEAVGPLLASLADGLGRQCSVVKALGDIAHADAVKPLIDLLGNRAYCASDEWIGSYIADALGALGDNEAVEPLLSALNYRIAQIRDYEVFRRASIVRALGAIGDARANKPLWNIVQRGEEEPYVIGCAIGALGEMSSSHALDAARIGMKSEIQEVREKALAVLKRLESLPSEQDAQSILLTEGKFAELVQMGEAAFEVLRLAVSDPNRVEGFDQVYKLLDEAGLLRRFVDFVAWHDLEHKGANSWARERLESRYWESVLEKNSKDKEALLRLGFVRLWDYAKLENAKELFEACLRLDRDLPEALLGLARCTLYRATTSQEVHELLQRASAQKPDLKDGCQWTGNDLRLWLGVHFLRQDEPALAVAHLRKAREVNPEGVSINGNLGEAYLECGYVDEAIEAYREETRINERDYSPHLYLSAIYEALGNAEQSILHKREAERINENMALSFEARSAVSDRVRSRNRSQIPSIQ